ncbi:hypothetical protein ASD81_20745 [Nocardioides sp. Root614]|nr:hypothetical protein ASD81_20745 [Nocardioides sp. Root614]KRA85612.1 hypothetical protein ASD84_24505 [Nocardioides sp. Root682]
MPGLRRMAVVVAAAGALTLGSAGGAHAGTWSHTDPAGDVHQFTEDAATPVPDRVIGDVVRTNVTHSRTHLVFRITLKQALPATDWAVFADIRTRVARFDLTMLRIGDIRGLVLLNAKGNKVRCSGLSRTLDGRVVRLVVPRACIGRPSLVRVGVGVTSSNPDGEFGEFGDDALRGTVRENLALSPRIYRG